MRKFKKRLPILSLKEFHGNLNVLTYIISSHGIQYDVKEITEAEIHFERHGASSVFDWSVEIDALYNAYTELKSFESIAFKKYLPNKYYQGRLILLQLGLLEFNDA